MLGKRVSKTPPTKDKTPTRKVLDWVQVILAALVLSFIIRVEVVSAYVIPSGSMIPTLVIGDRVLVNKLSYGLKNPFTGRVVLGDGLPNRGDIVVFQPPFQSPDPYIKRVIGLPGDVVEARDKVIHVNGRPLREPYIRHADPRILAPGLTSRDSFGPLRVPPGKLFVLGDNRDESNDSRFWGFADLDEVVGRAMIILWSWDWERLSLQWSRMLTLPD